ncbi:uncharacterized protein LACBIDRAFT_304505 [Laccaria bicolor S238N-H82]|uniref:Predicted protein n=1 Tax=Laccaria bicolor (strain S238N-H82 / ATCC MYA-4686) TaxID=486041 RepID=B0DLS1_LACBS|nr:uncharacterized protein LACBIDRAFT_304505 [Laccaria bicolor S238N-H82]EDR04442.1 predicted protein [Laccaria bicolor S238N-H82]|eukprot:XP_001884961.1 predicted protein [Laccaria bicolor S238N-H82]
MTLYFSFKRHFHLAAVESPTEESTIINTLRTHLAKDWLLKETPRDLSCFRVRFICSFSISRLFSITHIYLRCHHIRV